jgi:hypothetical protein
MDLISWRRWDETGSPEKVFFYVDTYSSDLVTDVSWAASQWTDVWFEPENEMVKFRLLYAGQTGRNPGDNDDWNVIGWGIPYDDRQPAETSYWGSGLQLFECDIIFNYHKPFAPHSPPGTFPTDKYCIRNSATHEFGHWVQLKDVSAFRAQDYDHYTMCNDPPRPVNTHSQESLECEDKYGLWYTYNEMTWSAPPLLARPEVADVPAEAVSIERTRLLQNYPDPFNPETWIPYELSKEADVSLELHDSAGYLVRKLVLGTKPKGRYLDKRRTIYWDGRNERGESVPSGVYFYTLKSADFSATRKMILLK